MEDNREGRKQRENLGHRYHKDTMSYKGQTIADRQKAVGDMITDIL